MKIYVSVPLKGREELIDFEKATTHLKSKGHKIINVYEDENFPMTEDVNYHIKKFKESEKAIREADVVIVESTYPGRRQGFEIARALDERKVVLAMYREEVGKAPTSPFLGNTSKNFLYRGYKRDNITQILEESLKIARDQVDTKFILIISPEIDKYLEWASTERRMHKAQLVRNAVEDMMNKDKEYKEFLKDIEGSSK